MIGKHYETSLRLEQFDKASQEVLNFYLVSWGETDTSIFSQIQDDISIS